MNYTIKWTQQYANTPALRTVKSGNCPWVVSGLSGECDSVAEQFKVPSWTVKGDVNSAAENCRSIETV